MDDRVCMDRISQAQSGVSHLDGSSLGETPQQPQGARSSVVERRTHNLPSSLLGASEGLRREVDEVGAAAASPTHDPAVGSVVLALEDRLLCAISARGNQRIGQLIENARTFTGHSAYCEEGSACLFNFDDEALVEAIEQYVAEHQV